MYEEILPGYPLIVEESLLRSTRSPPYRKAEPDIVPIEKDDDLWFPDGDVVISAVPSVHPGCRVHRDILERECKVLADYVTEDIKDSSRWRQQTEDGCPIVRINVNYGHLKTLLCAICFGNDYFYKRDRVVSVHIDDLIPLIKLGMEFGVQDLVQNGLARLKKYYPSNPFAWEDLTTREKYVETGAVRAPLVINLARITETPSLLPGAFLDLCDAYLPIDVFVDASPLHLYQSLSSEDLGRLIAGKAELDRARAMRMLMLLRTVPCEFCTKPDRCALTIQRTLQEISEDDLVDATVSTDYFSALDEWFWEQADRKLCGPCQAMFGQIDYRTRIRDWCNLPRMFDLKVDDWPADFNAVLAMQPGPLD